MSNRSHSIACNQSNWSIRPLLNVRSHSWSNFTCSHLSLSQMIMLQKSSHHNCVHLDNCRWSNSFVFNCKSTNKRSRKTRFFHFPTHSNPTLIYTSICHYREKYFFFSRVKVISDLFFACSHDIGRLLEHMQIDLQSSHEWFEHESNRLLLFQCRTFKL